MQAVVGVNKFPRDKLPTYKCYPATRLLMASQRCQERERVCPSVLTQRYKGEYKGSQQKQHEASQIWRALLNEQIMSVDLSSKVAQQELLLRTQFMRNGL